MTPSYPQDEHKKKNDAGDGCIDRDMQYPPVHLQYSGQIIIIPHIYIYNNNNNKNNDNNNNNNNLIP